MPVAPLSLCLLLAVRFVAFVSYRTVRSVSRLNLAFVVKTADVLVMFEAGARSIASEHDPAYYVSFHTEGHKPTF